MIMDNLAYTEPPVTELIEGKTYPMSPRPRIQHTAVAARIYRIFADYLEGKTCTAWPDGVDVYLDDKNRYIPDVMIVCDRSKIHDDGIHGAPDLVVEVLSPSTMTQDRGVKMRHYAAADVREYWIVSPFEKCVEVYLNHDGAFELDWSYAVYPDSDLVRMTEEERAIIRREIPISLYDDFSVDVEKIFRDVDTFSLPKGD